ncbi:MAG: hypothetical protein AAF773_08650 [Cyanobacteria bacterium P01_D01_bin.115]
MSIFERVKRLIEIGCAIAFGCLGLLALIQGGIDGVQFAAGFILLTVTFVVPLNSWRNTWRSFGGMLRWLLMAIGCFTVSV